jgi:uncharacterized protein (TIGR02266 family)
MNCTQTFRSGDTTIQVRFRQPRSRVRLAVFYGDDTRQLMTDYAVNMSSGGIFLESDMVLPVNTALQVEFNLPVNNRRIVCRSRVAWNSGSGHAKSRRRTGMGLQFLDLPLDEMQVIRNYIAEVGLKAVW